MVLPVKFCGLTHSKDIEVAVRLGVSAIGFVFYPPSPRYITPKIAQTLVKEIPAFTTIVALVVNMELNELKILSQMVAFDVIQFHGNESANDCQRLANAINKRWIKAIQINSDLTSDEILTKIDELKKYGASGVILDAYHPNKLGGTGTVFDWSKIPKHSPLPIYLAGGLTPDNISDVVQNTDLTKKISGVDVSGGIESPKGVKDEYKMDLFIKNLTTGGL